MKVEEGSQGEGIAREVRDLVKGMPFLVGEGGGEGDKLRIQGW